MQAKQPAYALKRELRHNTKLRPKDTRRIRASQAVWPASRKAWTGFFLRPGYRGRVSLRMNQSFLGNEFEYKVGQPYFGFTRHVHKSMHTLPALYAVTVKAHITTMSRRSLLSTPTDSTIQRKSYPEDDTTRVIEHNVLTCPWM